MRPGAAVRSLIVGLGLLAALATPAEAQRHKPGPVTIRGVAEHVRRDGFDLKTRTRGTLRVIVKPQTAIDEKGAHGRISLADGDHVGVRGFLTGSALTAIHVRIYPVKRKPKPYSLRGVVTSVQSSRLVVSSGGKRVTVTVGSGTLVQVGNLTGSIRQVGKGASVLVRVEQVGGTLVALRIHVYTSRPGPRVEVRGTVAAIGHGSIVVVAQSKRYTVAVTGGTAIHQGQALVSSGALKVGETVTVYACCAGGALTATSIHVLAGRQREQSATIQGSVAAVSRDRLAVRTTRGMLTVILTARTKLELGSAPLARGAVQVGDHVTIRATYDRGLWTASRVHVLAASRRPRRIDGRIVAVSSSGLMVLAPDGRRYSVVVSSGTTIQQGTSPIALRSIHQGDRARAWGQLSGTTLRANRITVTRAKVRVRTVTLRGTIVQVAGGSVVMMDSAGSRRQVHLASGVQIRMRNGVAPPEALFPGVPLQARGKVRNGTLIATSVTVTVRRRTLQGRILVVGRTWLRLQASRSGLWTVQVVSHTGIRDGTRSLALSALRPGAYGIVRGYSVQTGWVRAAAIDVLHPAVHLSGTVTAVGAGLTLQTSAGQSYPLHLLPRATVMASRADLTVTMADVPVGAHLRVQGTVGSDGVVQVSAVAIRLASVTLRGQVSHFDGAVLTLQSGGALYRVRTSLRTAFLQGSHTLQLGDVVVGDDVTVYGYKARPPTVLSRKVLVHRRRIGITGPVAAITSSGFTMSAPDGVHTVLVSAATLVEAPAGEVVAVGVRVRVSGYLRGDGVVLATRVRIVMTPRPLS